ncbi:hypothetical protein HOE67_02780 [Candidatus Peregrinibacteria bacterium]|jgi:DNA-binding Lrp family transcriptional regulator|nr:hypothetical protein [Candidatus Peregrinibacteria bacterium]MBT4056011.1 hypothetical protein [Candidatus Peregrinibacteria bacterium]
MSINSKLKELLLQANLSETETLIYLELQKSPAQNRWELVQRTGLSKSATYRAIEKLQTLKMVQIKDKEVRALSLKGLVAELSTSERNLKKVSNKLKDISPFLQNSKGPIEVFETYYTPKQIEEAYIFMSEHEYNVNIDFGDFENFVEILPSHMHAAYTFQNNRIKKARNEAICTTHGPHTSYFCTRAAEIKFKNKIKVLNLDTKGNFTIFSEGSDYVLFNNFDDPENPHSTLVKSKVLANTQRAQFKYFSQLAGK